MKMTGSDARLAYWQLSVVTRSSGHSDALGACARMARAPAICSPNKNPVAKQR